MKLLAIAFGLLVGACSGEHGGAGSPTPPANVTVERLGGGGHVTWSDVSDDEDEFVVQRADGSGSLVEIAAVEFDTEQFHDEPLTDGTTYRYMVMSVNADGEGHSNEVTYTH